MFQSLLIVLFPHTLPHTVSSYTFCSNILTAALDLAGRITAYELSTLNISEKKETVEISLKPKDQLSPHQLTYPSNVPVNLPIDHDYSDLLIAHEYKRGKA